MRQSTAVCRQASLLIVVVLAVTFGLQSSSAGQTPAPGMPTTTVAELKDFHDPIRRFCDDHLKGDLKKKAEEQKPEPAER